MDRRNFLLHSASSSSVLAMLGSPTIALAQSANLTSRATSIEAWRRRIQAMLDKGRLPIIDMEATYVLGVTNIKQMVAWMDELGIAQIVFAPAPVLGSDTAIELHREYPDYFIPCTSSAEFPQWARSPVSFVSSISNDLKTGNYFAMGEYEFRHYPSPEQVETRATNRDITIALDSAAGRALFELSEQTGMSFQIHYEIEDPLLPVLEDMLARYPKALVIWCHLGMIRYPDRTKKYSSAYVSSLIERFPSLHFDLAVPRPENVYIPSGARDSTIYQDGKLAENWKTLMEKFPDRFVAASDYRPPVAQNYPAAMDRQRNLILASLNEAARHKIAYANAWRLLTGKTWNS